MKTAIDATNLTVAFQTANGVARVLNNLSFTIKRGEWVAIVGRNGSGKSTLARVLTNLCGISSGSLTILDAPVSKESTAFVQMVFQNPEAQIVGETVYEDVSFGLSVRAVPNTDIRPRVMEALAEVHMDHLIDTSVTALSGGQKQLLCIASCLAVKAEILIFDESTAMLDEGARQEVKRVVKQLHKAGKTVIWITQHMEEAAEAERILALDKGQIAFNGSPRTFFYGDDRQFTSPCRRLGFTPPFVIEVTEHLRAQGVHVEASPLHADELVEVIQEICQFK